MMKQIIVLAALCASATAFAPAARPTFVSASSLSAEKVFNDSSDFENEIKKLEKEAEDRMDAKISEMKSKIESTGGK
ncbi:hypothetical protein MPSEU_000013400 [Mayamaea pseudoterrestris]|nr:hypothetical protein MPSEU_000013400 [Mayamaea pseudoterrestris]